MGDSSTNVTQKSLSANVLAALEGVRFIAQHIRNADKNNEVRHKTKSTNRILLDRK